MTNQHLKKGLRPKSNKPSIRFSDHLLLEAVPELPATDPTLTLLQQIKFNMDGNGPDSLWGPGFPGAGDCVTAEADHALSVIDYLTTGTYKPWTKAQIEAFYATQNPEFTWDTNPKTGSDSPADGGMDIQISLEQLVKQGLILGFAEVDVTDTAELALAQYLGLALWCGVEIHEAQMTEFNSGKPWDYVKTSPDDGGHGVPYTWADQLVTWAQLQGVTAAFNKHQLTQCFFVLTQNHINSPTVRAGYNLDSFAAAVKQITSGKVVVPVVPTPAPPAPVVGNSLQVNLTDQNLITHVQQKAASKKEDTSTWVQNELKTVFHLS